MSKRPTDHTPECYKTYAAQQRADGPGSFFGQACPDVCTCALVERQEIWKLKRALREHERAEQRRRSGG